MCATEECRIASGPEGGFSSRRVFLRGVFQFVASRLLIADDHAIVRRLLRLLLETHEGWLVCGEAENGSQAISKAVELRPDLIIDRKSVV